MPSTAKAITAEELATWLTPIESVRILSKYLGVEAATSMILSRLKGGVITSAAETSAYMLPGKTPVNDKIVNIPSRYWSNLAGASNKHFWQIGDVRFFLGREFGRPEQSTIHYYGVRFDPHDIQSAIPQGDQIYAASAKTAEASAPATGNQVDPIESNHETPTERGPRVSDADLAAWYGLYKSVYEGAADTEDMAILSAQGMFPGKSVSRDRVRKLRGPQKRGRPPLHRE
jgi:hypothetical protein